MEKTKGAEGPATRLARTSCPGPSDAQRIDTLFHCSYTYAIMLKSESGARSRALVWWGAVALTLLAGYADLVRGGETLAPILLVVGYCVLIPAAILKS